MLAHGNALQLQIAVALTHGDQRQVGRATAHVHHQDDVAMLDLLAPVAAAGLDPAVQRGLRLFQQGEVGKPGDAAGLGRQLARGGSNEAGMVTVTSCWANGASGWACSQAQRRCER